MEPASETYFAIDPANLSAAVAHVTDRGFAPSRIETDKNGLALLVFAPVDEERMFDLARALPIQFSAKRGYIME
jgi:hypothetical protein